MDFSPSPDQEALVSLTRTIVDDLVDSQSLRAADLSGGVDEKLWRALADAGVIAAATPRPTRGDGGPGQGDAATDGLGVMEQCAVLSELGRVLAPVPLRTTTVAAAALARFGTDEQRARWLEPALTGDLVLTAAPALTGLGGAATGSLSARPAPGGWVLDGTYDMLPFGRAARLVVADATTPDGSSIFLVQPGAPGVRIIPQSTVNGGGACRLVLDGVHVADDRRLPGDTTGWLLDHATVALCAEQVGVLTGALERTADHARTREQFGRPIGAFQAVSQRLADAWIDVDAVRLTTWNAAWSLDQAGRPGTALPGSGAGLPIATAKFWAAEAGHRVAHTVVHVHGGTGIDLDHDAHRYFTAAKLLEFDLGTATAHLCRLGRLMTGI